MADEVKQPNYLLWGLLAVGGYMVYKSTATYAAPSTTTASTVDATAAWGGNAGAVAAATPATTGAAAPAAAAAAPTSATPTVRPGYPLDGEPDIVFATATGLANANGPSAMFDKQWGDGSRNVRVTLARTVGQKYHIFVEDLQAALGFRWNQGGFGSWDDMYYSYINLPDSLAGVLTAYNQQNPSQQIAPRW